MKCLAVIKSDSLLQQMREFPVLRMYLDHLYHRNGIFISEFEATRGDNGKINPVKDTLELKNCLFDYGFNEDGGEATELFDKYPKGFKFRIIDIVEC